jgi:hypothetical protein
MQTDFCAIRRAALGANRSRAKGQGRQTADADRSQTWRCVVVRNAQHLSYEYLSSIILHILSHDANESEPIERESTFGMLAELASCVAKVSRLAP